LLLYSLYAETALNTLRESSQQVAQDLATRPENVTNLATNQNMYAQAVNTDGSVVDYTSNFNQAQIESPLLTNAIEVAAEPQFTMTELEGERLLIYTIPAANPAGAAIQVAVSLVEYDESLATLQNSLALGSLFTSLLTFGLGWVMSGVALRPIQKMTETAQRIGEQQDFSQRVPTTRPKDELGQLAHTFNQMLTALQSAYLHTENALQSQKQFTADASHELRTPLTTIRGNIELLRMENPALPPAEQKEVLADMAEECDRLIRLVQELLLLARSDRQELLPCAEEELVPVVEEAVRQMGSERPINIEAAGRPVGMVNRDALKQTLLILLDNAVKHTPTNTPITVKAATGRVAVCDQGPGISAAHLPHIFDRFYRGDSTRSSQGYGLGLAIAMALVQAQKGELTVECPAGGGAVFVVRMKGKFESKMTHPEL
jgi:signal transduction histidine kinase